MGILSQAEQPVGSFIMECKLPRLLACKEILPAIHILAWFALVAIKRGTGLPSICVLGRMGVKILFKLLNPMVIVYTAG